MPAARMSMSELPQGAFVYPPDLKPSRAPLVIGLLLAAAAAIGAVVYFVVLKPADGGSASAPAEPPTETVAATTTAPAVTDGTTDAGAAEAVATGRAAAPEAEPEAEPEPEPEPEPELEPEPEPERAAGTNRRTTATRPSAATRPSTATQPSTGAKPRATSGRANASAGRAEPSDEGQDDERVEQPAPKTAGGGGNDGGCDEVGCVLEKYARPCCAKYKPADTGFQPAAADAESLTKPQIKAGVDRVRPRVIDCAQKHPAKGTVKVGVSVTGEGVVENVSVKDAPDDALGECVASAMRKAKFAKTANGGSFTYPFVF